jgi:hypothetical protein
MTIRTEAETKILREEAERLARMNWRRPEISRLLDVPLHTLAKWAFEGGWRAKDLAAEAEPERLAALNEQLRQRAEYTRSMCGRSAAPLEDGQLEYKSTDYGEAHKPAADPAPDLQYPSSDPDYGPWASDEKLPKFLTRGGPKDQRVCWAAPQLWARTPPWAPGNNREAPEMASLFLAEDLMRQGLLVEAERALRFTKNWLAISKQVFDKREEEDQARLEYQQQQEEERAREKARCKALGLPDPVEVLEAQVARGLAQMAERERRANNNNNNSAANPNAAAPPVIDA